MSTSETKTITYTPPAVQLKVSVELEGDLIKHYVDTVEQDLRMYYDYLSESLLGNDPKYVTYCKKNIRRYLRDIGLDGTYHIADDNDWLGCLRMSITIFYNNRYDEDEYGHLTSNKIAHFVRKYLRTPESEAKLKELIDDDWLQDLLDEKGIKAVNKAKRTPL